MLALDTFNRITGELIGQPVSHVWRGYGSALFLEFGRLTPRARRDGSQTNPDGDFTLMIEWSWRIENATSIICGSWSEEQLWVPAFDHLRDALVVAITTFGRLPEIDVELSNGLHVVSFMTAEGQPEWSLADRRTAPDVWIKVEGGVLVEERPSGSLN
jgi:hypothetical protein